MRQIINAINKLMEWLGHIASLLLILLVLIMAFNVAYSASSIGLAELSWHFYAAIFLLGIPYALKSGAHVRVDLFYEKFSPKTQAQIDLIGTLIFLIPTCVVVCWSGWNFTVAAYGLGDQPTGVADFFSKLVSSGIGEKSQDPGGLLNRWIIKGVIPLSFFFLFISAIGFMLEKVETLITIKASEA